MSQVLDQEWQSLAANAVCHAAEMSRENIRIATARYEAPSAIYRPALSIDGDQWCALYGDNLQDGVAGFGKSPADAMWDFDRAWSAKLASQPAPTPGVVQAVEPVAWAVFDSRGYYRAFDTYYEAESFCDRYNKRQIDPLKPYTLVPLYAIHPEPQAGKGEAAPAAQQESKP